MAELFAQLLSRFKDVNQIDSLLESCLIKLPNPFQIPLGIVLSSYRRLSSFC